jgi:GNAT superfamily N-acetyltransferase
VHWDGPHDTDVAERWPDRVEVNHLHVLAGARNQGVGRALIEAAEGLCRGRGIELIGLAAADDNVDAARLYGRLGYVDSGVRVVTNYEYIDPDGDTREATERNRFLLKRLRPQGGSE